ncbi:MAG: hypothetical protein HYY64_02065 [Candidatus Rokubacteria bacterium]|nr:hypothetical protein [Candidatus Rokubacteria bacterium]
MRKAAKSYRASETLPEYDFSKGIRGKYAIWAPLIDFQWAGSEWQIANDTWIRPGSAYRDYEEFVEFKHALSEEERERCRDAEHRLGLVHVGHDELSKQAKINSFLLALWIVRPTRTHVPFRFEVEKSGSRSVARILDRFQWTRGQAEDEIKDQHLRKVGSILLPLRTVFAARRRLRNAVALTFRGCVASEWQSAFICFSAAAEALLAYSWEPGLSDRLSESYAKLVSASRSGGESAKDQFRRLYSIRSDIIHGRAYDYEDPNRNLTNLANFSDILRRLWGAVLDSEETRVALEGDDKQRRNFFLKL